MTREEQTDWLCRLRTDLNNGVIFTPWNKEFTEALNDVLEQEPRWIPVSERYPKPEDEYKMFLVTDDKGVVSVQVFYMSIDEEPQPYFSGMVNVIAWMPLPEPFEPQESEDNNDTD